jgi:hypothetical protein
MAEHFGFHRAVVQKTSGSAGLVLTSVGGSRRSAGRSVSGRPSDGFSVRISSRHVHPVVVVVVVVVVVIFTSSRVFIPEK